MRKSVELSFYFVCFTCEFVSIYCSVTLHLSFFLPIYIFHSFDIFFSGLEQSSYDYYAIGHNQRKILNIQSSIASTKKNIAYIRKIHKHQFQSNTHGQSARWFVFLMPFHHGIFNKHNPRTLPSVDACLCAFNIWITKKYSSKNQKQQQNKGEATAEEERRIYRHHA